MKYEYAVEKYNNFVYWVANKMGLSFRDDYDDIIQEGFIGLLQAAEKYEKSKGKFTTYSFYWIKARIIEYLHNARLIRLPMHVSSIESPEVYKNTFVKSLDNYIYCDGEYIKLVDVLETPEIEKLRDPYLKEIMNRALEILTPREKKIIEERMRGRTLRETGYIMGVSVERIRQIEARAFKKLRIFLNKFNLT